MRTPTRQELSIAMQLRHWSGAQTLRDIDANHAARRHVRGRVEVVACTASVFGLRLSLLLPQSGKRAVPDAMPTYGSNPDRRSDPVARRWFPRNRLRYVLEW